MMNQFQSSPCSAELTTECVLTPCCLSGSGYGNWQAQGKQTGHHRQVFMETHNLSPEALNGKVVRHLCNNRACINPKHLALGTQKDNMQDRLLTGNFRNGKSSVLPPDTVRCIRRENMLRSELAKKYNRSITVIWKVLNKVSPYDYD